MLAASGRWTEALDKIDECLRLADVLDERLHSSELHLKKARFLLAMGADHAAVQDSLAQAADRKSTRLNSSHLVISYAVFCLKKKISPCQAVTISLLVPLTPPIAPPTVFLPPAQVGALPATPAIAVASVPVELLLSVRSPLLA